LTIFAVFYIPSLTSTTDHTRGPTPANRKKKGGKGKEAANGSVSLEKEKYDVNPTC
jgi:hypothetical protein